MRVCTRFVICIGVAALSVAWSLATPTPASADTFIYSLYNREDTIYIGMVEHNSTGTLRPHACYTGSGLTQWSLLGGTSGLDDNYHIYAKVLSGTDTEDDVIRVIRSTTSVSGPCAGDGGTDWEALDFNGYILKGYGGDGDDVIRTGDDTSARYFGNDDDDIIISFSANSVYGNDGSDILEGWGGTNENMYGGNDQDCVTDVTGTYNFISCEGSSDDVWDHTAFASAPTLCEVDEPTCLIW